MIEYSRTNIKFRSLRLMDVINLSDGIFSAFQTSCRNIPWSFSKNCVFYFLFLARLTFFFNTIWIALISPPPILNIKRLPQHTIEMNYLMQICKKFDKMKKQKQNEEKNGWKLVTKFAFWKLDPIRFSCLLNLMRSTLLILTNTEQCSLATDLLPGRPLFTQK